MSGEDAVAVIAGLFASEGAADYLGEPVTQAAHMLQAAALAAAAGAPDAIVAAALLHDVGHFTGAVSGQELMRGTDNRHGEAGAAWLSQWFGPEVTEPVRLHVEAKRYLCAKEPGYLERLSGVGLHARGAGRPAAGRGAGGVRGDAARRRRLPGPPLGRRGKGPGSRRAAVRPLPPAAERASGRQ